jgi:molybdenum cofactor cytidylyltransferase
MPTPAPSSPPGVILLAAGFSRRFGGIKLNALLPNGHTVAGQTLARIKAATDNILVVTRPELLNILLAAGSPPDNTVLCPDADKGMGHTLACGIQSIPHWSGALVCLADMPFIETTTYTQLLDALREDTIIVPEYRGQRGNPVGFGSKWFELLAAATGDVGAREVMKKNSEAIVSIALDDEGVCRDVDVPGDLCLEAHH